MSEEKTTIKEKCWMLIRVVDQSNPNELRCAMMCDGKECPQYDKCVLWRMAEELKKHLGGKQ